MNIVDKIIIFHIFCIIKGTTRAQIGPLLSPLRLPLGLRYDGSGLSLLCTHRRHMERRRNTTTMARPSPLSSLPAKLALGLTLLSGALVLILFQVHKASHFSSSVPSGWVEDMPYDVGGMGEGGRQRDLDVDESEERGERIRRQREMLEREAEILEEEEEVERQPMNVILFYADDWRHDVSRIGLSLFL